MSHRASTSCRSIGLLVALGVVGCVGSKQVGELAETSTGTGSTSSDDTSGGAGPATFGTSMTTEHDSSSTASTTAESESGSTGPIAGCDPELPPIIPDECSVYDQDCPACYRCTWAKDENGFASNQVPSVCRLAPEDGGLAPGAACTTDIATGNDDCEIGSFCFPQPGAEVTPTCIPFCATNIDWTCDDPDRTCVGTSSAGTFGCFPSCDPTANDCVEGSVCHYLFTDGFACFPGPPGTVGAGEPCSFEGECEPGMLCVDEMYLGDSCEGTSCCTPFCDATLPGSDAECAASDPALSCRNGCGGFEGPPGLEHVGLCLSDYTQPGACPPEDVEPNIPWCSGINEDQCGELSSFGGGDDCNDYCHCYSDCEDPGDCPVPTTGTAVPECHQGEAGEANACVLPCDAGQVCPDGMVCWEGYDWCLWPTPNGSC